MSIEITVRHADVPWWARDYVEEKTRRIVGEFDIIEHVHVVLEMERHVYLAEAMVQAGHRVRVEAKASGNSVNEAVDVVMDKVKAQLRKSVDKLRDHKRKVAES